MFGAGNHVHESLDQRFRNIVLLYCFHTYPSVFFNQLSFHRNHDDLNMERVISNSRFFDKGWKPRRHTGEVEGYLVPRSMENLSCVRLQIKSYHQTLTAVHHEDLVRRRNGGIDQRKDCKRSHGGTLNKESTAIACLKSYHKKADDTQRKPLLDKVTIVEEQEWSIHMLDCLVFISTLDRYEYRTNDRHIPFDVEWTMVYAIDTLSHCRNPSISVWVTWLIRSYSCSLV